MAIDLSGQDMLPRVGLVAIEIRLSHPLMRLAYALPWRSLTELAVKDLKNTTNKGCWWMGRKIKVRIHLGAYLLQRLYNLTDRKVEYQLKDNAAFQLFSGFRIVDGWFAPDHTKIEEFRNRLSPETHRQLIINLCEILSDSQIARLPWNIRRAYEQVKTDAWRYLLDVAHFTRSHTIKPEKILSFHARELACIKKGKVGKEMEFGRVFQLGRIKGNFLFVLECTSVRMNDKQSFVPFLNEHAFLFGEDAVETVATDKGYWSAKNRKILQKIGKHTEGMQKPSTIRREPDADLSQQEHLHNRRARIEPLIGHTKHGGQLGRSRMKSDKATLGAGYGSVLGFNLRQMI